MGISGKLYNSISGEALRLMGGDAMTGEDERDEAQNTERTNQPTKKTTVVDAIRHVGPTLEAEGIFLPTGELPENRIESEMLTDEADIRAVTEDEYDREADAMGAERLVTRLPGDTNSDPHADSTSEEDAAANSGERRRGKRGQAA
jgi:hypothetical protein